MIPILNRIRSIDREQEIYFQEDTFTLAMSRSESRVIFKVRVWHLLVSLVVLCVFIPSFYTRNPIEYFTLFVAFVLLIPFTGGLIHLFSRLAKPILKMEQASPEELLREDDVFLKGIAFTQSTLVIVLFNLAEPTPIVVLFRWTTPLAAAVIFVIKAYCRIKESPQWRALSTLGVLAIFLSNLFLIIVSIVPRPLVVADIDVTSVYLLLLFASLFLFVSEIVWVGLKKRYGC